MHEHTIDYSYAAEHPAEVRLLVVMDSVIPGFIPTGRQSIWWFSFHQTPDVPEALGLAYTDQRCGSCGNVPISR